MDSKLEQAKKWAESRTNGNYALSEETQAVAKVIQSLPDRWVDAEKLRELVEKADKGLYSAGSFLRRVKDLLPTPPLPTLADMSFEELKAYVGGEVTVDGWANPTMLVSVIGDEGAVLARRLNKPWPFVEVRPLSDLAPIAAPGQEAEDAPEPVQPRPEDVPEGEVWMIRLYENVDPVPAFRVHQSKYGPGKRWAHYRVGGSMLGFADDEDITLVSRLVPEHKENA